MRTTPRKEKEGMSIAVFPCMHGILGGGEYCQTVGHRLGCCHSPDLSVRGSHRFVWIFFLRVRQVVIRNHYVCVHLGPGGRNVWHDFRLLRIWAGRRRRRLTWRRSESQNLVIFCVRSGLVILFGCWWEKEGAREKKGAMWAAWQSLREGGPL